MGIMIYRTIIIGSFLNTYIDDYSAATANFSLGDYINLYSFIVVLLIIIFTIIVMSVMIVKQKPKKLYIINLILYIAVMVLYAVDYSILNNIYTQILDVRVSKAIRDITFILAGCQVISCILTLVRASGFDIKQFDFNNDLQKLEIDTKDNEEFEVAVEFDKNKLERNIIQKLRSIKYTYVEHKFIFNVSTVILVVIIAFLIFINIGVYEDHYKENQAFNASGLVTNIKQSYLTQTDQNGNLITLDENGQITEDQMLLVISFDIRTLTSDAKQTLNTGLITLRINGQSFAHTNNYNDKLTDIGTPYIGQELSTEFTSYLLVFEIPSSLIDEKIELKFNDEFSYVKGEMGAKNIFVKLNPLDLTEKKGTAEAKVGETLAFDDSLLGGSELTINNVEFNDKFKVTYNFCSKTDNCYESYEYVTPTATGNYYKTLMKINGTFTLDTITNLEGISDVYYFLNKYGVIYYKINDKWYSHYINSQKITPKIGKENNTYYLEVNSDVKNASEIYLTFKIRDYNYKYVIK